MTQPLIRETVSERNVASAAVGGGVPGVADVIIPNEAGFAGLVALTNGQSIFVLSHRSMWRAVPAAISPPLVAHEVIATGTAGINAVRTDYSDQAWRIGVNDIFIDPVAGNDENTGFTALTALKTGQELWRRWGWGSPQIVGPNLATSPDGFLTVHIQNDLVSPDQLDVNVIIASNASIRFRGAILAGNVIRTSTLTAASTAANRAAPLGGTRLRLVDAATATWVPDMAANRRGRITTGAQAGATFQPQTNIGAGGAVDCSCAQTTNEPGFSLSPTTVTPANGSTYVIEKLVQCNFGLFHLTQQINPSFGGFNAFCNLVDLNLPATPNQQWAPIVDGQNFSGPNLNLYQCTIDRGIDLTQAGPFNFVACYWFNAFISHFGEGAGCNIAGGGFNGAGGALAGWLWACKNEQSAISGDCVANNSLCLIGSDTAILNAASWNALVFAGVNAGGHGMLVGIQGFGAMRSRCCFKGTIWGNGNGGAGVLIGAACKGAGAPQNITGTQGDGKLANNPSAGAAAFNTYWDQVTGTYRGAAGLFAASAFTWALLAAAKAAPGYGGSVHFPDQDSSFVALETTA